MEPDEVVTPAAGSRPKRLLVLAPQFPPMGGGGVIRVFNFVRHLADMGWEVTVISAEADAVFARTRAPRDESLLEELRRRGVNVVAAPVPDWPPPPPVMSVPVGVRGLPKRIYRRIVHELWPVIVRLLRPAVIDSFVTWADTALAAAGRVQADGYMPDVVFATSPPHSAQYAAARVARLFDAPLVTDLRDQWVGNPHPSIAGESAAARLANSLMERYVMRNACMAVTPTDASTAVIGQRYARMRDRALVIPNGYDGEAWEAIRETPREGLFTLSYVGTLYPPRDIAALADGLRHALQARPELAEGLRLRIVGPLEAEYRETLRDAVGEAFEETGPVDSAESLREMARADVLLVILHTGEGSSSAIPGKIYEYMAARRSVLGLVAGGAAAATIREFGLGPVADPRDAGAIGDAVLALHERWRAGGLADGLPSADAVRAFDRRSEAAALDRVLRACAIEGVVASGREDDQNRFLLPSERWVLDGLVAQSGRSSVPTMPITTSVTWISLIHLKWRLSPTPIGAVYRALKRVVLPLLRALRGRA